MYCMDVQLVKIPIEISVPLRRPHWFKRKIVSNRSKLYDAVTNGNCKRKKLIGSLTKIWKKCCWSSFRSIGKRIYPLVDQSFEKRRSEQRGSSTLTTLQLPTAGYKHLNEDMELQETCNENFSLNENDNASKILNSKYSAS